MNVLAFFTLTVTGFTACAEFGSYAFVHPVLRRLTPRERVIVEQGLLRTFGRIMPAGMPATLILAIVFASTQPGILSWTAGAALAIANVSTVIVNVPINLATGRWDAEHLPADWQDTRNRWDTFQGVRSWLLLIGFILICAAATT